MLIIFWVISDIFVHLVPHRCSGLEAEMVVLTASVVYYAFIALGQPERLGRVEHLLLFWMVYQGPWLANIVILGV